MAIEITKDGFQTMTFEEVFASWVNGLYDIYGDNYVYDESSPDYQFGAIYSYNKIELQDLVQDVYLSYDYNQAQGSVLNARAKDSGLFRKAGSFTTVDVDITTDRAVNLIGLDGDSAENGFGFRVSDGSGNQFILLDSQNIATAGTYTFSFRASEQGEIPAEINTITNLDTIILGVTSCTNSTSHAKLGSKEETDASLRERIRISFANRSTADANALRGQLLNLNNVDEVIIYENFTNTIDNYSIPPKSIWCVVNGGSNEDIANTIFENRAICDTKGDTEVIITTQSGQYVPIRFDRPSSASLYLKFDLKKTNLLQTFDLGAITQDISDNISFDINQFAETSKITVIIKNAIDNNGGGGVAINVLLSKDNINWSEFVEVDAINNRFVLSTSNINISEI